MTRTRDDVLREFGLDGLPDWLDVWAEAGRCRDTDGENVRRMTDEIVRLRAALTAASEPVSNAYTLPDTIKGIIDAAVAYEQWQGKWYDYTVASSEKPAKQQRALIEAVRKHRAAMQTAASEVRG